MADTCYHKAFCDLPDACVEGILDFLPARDLLAVQVTCRRFYNIGHSRRLWIHKLRSDYGLKIAADKDVDPQVPQTLYKNLVAERQASHIQFRGLLTDGGVDEGLAVYWVDNMFQPDKQMIYCTEMERCTDVRVVAALLPDLRDAWCCSRASLYDRRRLELVEDCGEGGGQGENVPVLYDRQALARLGMAPAGRTAVAQSIVVSREGRLTCPVRCGAVFVANYCPAPGWREDQVARRLCRATEVKSVSDMKGLKSAAAVVKASKDGELPRVRAKKTSLHGEWVEFEDSDSPLGEFRPLLWFRFYSRKEATAARRKNEEWQLLNDPPYVCASPVHHPRQASQNGAGVPEASEASGTHSVGTMSSELTSAESEPEFSVFPPLAQPSTDGAGSSNPSTTEQQNGRVGQTPAVWAGPSTSTCPGGPEAAGSSAALQTHVASASNANQHSFSNNSTGIGNGAAIEGTGEFVDSPATALPSAWSANEETTPIPSSAPSTPNVSVTLWGAHELADSDPEWDDFDDTDGPFGGHAFWNPGLFFRPSSTNIGTYGRNKLVMQLSKPVACNLMCVLLIDSEDLMAEYKDEHESPNIDVNYVMCKGLKADIPKGMRLVG